MRAWFLCCLGVASHILIDCTNTYGVRLLLPFSSRWFSLDLNSLYDGWILAALTFAAFWPIFSGLVSSEIGSLSTAGRGSALFALAFFVLFDLGRAVLHHRAISQLEVRLYQNEPPLHTAALPQPFNPFQWVGLVETSNQYRLSTVNTLAEFDPQQATIFYKGPERQSLENAKRTEPFRYFLYFARYPVWSEMPIALEGEQGTKIDLTDLRFGTPWAGSFHCFAIEDTRKEVVRAWFSYGSESDPRSSQTP